MEDMDNDCMSGHLLMDDIKLKNGIMWNSRNNAVTGFVKEELNKVHMMNEILGMESKINTTSGKIYVYAIQWRLISTRGTAHTSNYYYNTECIDGNMITNQFIEVMTLYEKIGAKIYGIISSGGRSNKKDFNTLFQKQHIFREANFYQCVNYKSF